MTEPILPAEIKWMLEKMLRRVANAFQLLVSPKTKVFVSLRERRQGRTEEEYVTILREGNVESHERQKNSLPLLDSCKMVKRLRESFFDKNNKDCVLLTGSSCKDTWEPQPNDGRMEDLSVLLGAVFSKTWNMEKEKVNPFGFDNDDPVSMEWILCVAADSEGAFTASHKHLMKCFTDTFGLLLNVFLRHAQQWPPNNNSEKGVPSQKM